MSRPDLIEQLATFSDRLARELRTVPRRSLWVGEKFATFEPHQIIVHYTASPFFWGNIRWFLQESLDSRVSAHYLVADRWDSITRRLAAGLPAVSTLPTPIVEIVEPDRVAWHATAANHRALGIEIVNAGPVKTIRRAKNAVINCRGGGTFTPYAVEQIEAVRQLITALQAVLPSPVDPENILGHEHVQQNKIDPGPLFPLHSVRAQLGGGSAVDRFAAREWFFANGGAAWLQTFAAANDWHATELPKMLLAAMGFHVRHASVGGFDVPQKTVVLFQQLMRLTPDGVIGPKTKAALTQRWADVDFVGDPMDRPMAR